MMTMMRKNMMTVGGWVTLPCRLHLVKTRHDIDLEEVDTLRHDNNSG